MAERLSMGLPIDIGAVLEEAIDIKSAAETPIAVSVYIDESAPADLAAHVRAAFSSANPQVRVSIIYVNDSLGLVRSTDDMAVIVAGFGEKVGASAAELRAAGVPVMVVCTCPDLVSEMAQAFGAPVPEGDLVYPHCEKGAISRQEPIVLDEPARASLDKRMGEWVCAVCREKRLAFAMSFPFVRKPLALDAVNTTSLQNAGVGFVVFIPGADMPVMTLNQAKMLLQIAAAYGCPMNIERAKELALVVGGAFALRGLARQAVAVVPGLGWAIKAAVGYAGTVAMGRAAIEYFEAGGDAAGFAAVVGKARQSAVDLAGKASETPVGHAAASKAKDAVYLAFDKIRTCI